jgi:oxygen-independent coproporphyrinogen-3 oxidase
MTTLSQYLNNGTYGAYAYAYPHKTAYGSIAPPLSLREVWKTENRDALFLYIHIPFCEMRCGFCNLFTQTNAQKDLITAYLDTLTREAKQVKSSLGESQFAQMAIGGGTPTFLEVDELERLWELIREIMGVDSHHIPTSVEVSPSTATPERLELLKQQGVDRISMGIQSFIPQETDAAGRPQRVDNVYTAIDRIKSLNFPTINLDLIYGLPHQTITTWLESLQIALKFSPEELYLYPLYVRPLTGLGRSKRQWNDERRNYYRHGRDFLLSHGYEQVSMRMFRRKDGIIGRGSPVYCCQTDGMVGLGCGARSYTTTVHYSSEYAVGMGGIQEIIANYVSREDDSFRWVNYGYALDLDDRQRRFLIQSLLQWEGLSLRDYQTIFQSEAIADFPQLNDLFSLDLAEYVDTTDRRIILTSAGVEVSDIIGMWLYSAKVRELMEGYQWQ